MLAVPAGRSAPIPRRVLEVSLDGSLPPIAADDGAESYDVARVLVRLHGHPLGLVELELDAGGASPQALSDRIIAELGSPLRAHLAADGMSVETDLALGAGPAPSGCSYDIASTAEEPFVSVVIATRGRAHLLETCLEALLKSRYGAFEVIVVDNSPDDPATRDLVERWGDARLRHTPEPQTGISIARNRGLASARGELVAFIDDDVRVDAGWLRAIALAFSAVGGVQCVTTLIVPLALDTSAQLLLEEFGGYGKGFTRRIYDLEDYRDADPLYPYSAGIFGSGASMAFRTATLRELGGFDTRLSVGGEDLDLFLAVVLGGARLVYEPAAIAWHQHPRDYAALRRTMFSYGAGLTGVMTKWALRRPTLAAGMARRLPAAVTLALSPSSRKNTGKSAGYPGELSRRERAGMLAGPWLFARAAWRARR